MLKRTLPLLLALLIVLSLPLSVRAKEQPFQGTRSFTVRGNISDIENYINGGRSVLDLCLRRELPDWADYTLRTEGQTLTIRISFPFSSYADYEQKLAALLTAYPALLFDPEEGMLLEGFNARDLSSFLILALEAATGDSGKDLHAVLKSGDNTIVLNGQEHTFSGNVAIRSHTEETIPLEWLMIRTEESADGTFLRTFTMRPAEHSVQVLKALEDRVGSWATLLECDEEYTLEARLEAWSVSELAELTMRCLDTACSIRQDQVPLEGRTVTVRRTEYICLEPLISEDGSFHAIWVLPEGVHLEGTSENYLNVWDQEVMTLSFPRALSFDSVTVTTDASRLFGRIRRSIHCTLPVSLAQPLHEGILEELSRRLVDGCALDVWDEAGVRHYEISWSAWSRKALDEITSQVMGRRYDSQHQPTHLPYGTVRGRETFPTDRLLEDTAPPMEQRAVYLLPPMSRVTGILKTDRVKWDSGALTVRFGPSDDVSYRWQQPVAEYAVLWLLGAVLLLWGILSAVRLVKARLAASGKRRGRHLRPGPAPKVAPAPRAVEPPVKPSMPVPERKAPEPVRMPPEPVRMPPEPDVPPVPDISVAANPIRLSKRRGDASPPPAMPLPAQAEPMAPQPPEPAAEAPRISLSKHRDTAARSGAPAAPVLADRLPDLPPIPREERKTGRCPRCGGALQGQAGFCVYCGLELK